MGSVRGRTPALLGKTSAKKNRFLSGIAQITCPPPNSGNLYNFFGRQKGIYKVYFLIRARASPPPSFGQCPKEKNFFFWRCSLIYRYILAPFCPVKNPFSRVVPHTQISVSFVSGGSANVSEVKVYQLPERDKGQ